MSLLSPPRFQFSPLKLIDTPTPRKLKTKRSPSSTRSRSPSSRSPRNVLSKIPSFDYESNIIYSSAQPQTPLRPITEILDDIKVQNPSAYKEILQNLKNLSPPRKRRYNRRKIIFGLSLSPEKSISRSPKKSTINRLPKKSTITGSPKKSTITGSPKKSITRSPEQSEDLEPTQII